MNLRCIVVDDEPLAVKMLENFISRTPFLSLEASFTDPVQALSEIRARQPHLVFLDIQMPDLSGMELVDKLGKILGINKKFQLAMILLPDELYKGQNKTYRIVIGDPIPWQTFDGSRKPVEWAAWVREKVYDL